MTETPEERRPRLTFSRRQRVRRPKEFGAVFAEGAGAARPELRIVARPNGLEHSRLGLAVSRKVSRKAVVRNRIKRWLREIYRQHPEAHLPPLDLVAIPRVAVLELSYRELETVFWDLVGVCRKRIARGEVGSRRRRRPPPGSEPSPNERAGPRGPKRGSGRETS